MYRQYHAFRMRSKYAYTYMIKLSQNDHNPLLIVVLDLTMIMIPFGCRLRSQNVYNPIWLSS